ncbi:MAG: pseudaminic acid synthase [Bdellovibrionales bacterium]|nr:pseudaminic acid synthase [Bdellovibrionales bacterium]
MKVNLGGHVLGDEKPFIVAEMSGNHNQSLDKALEIVDAAAAAGVQALKIQTYTADTLTIDCDNEYFQITDPNSLWKGQNLYQLYQQAFTPWEWHEPIFNRCKEHGMIGFSTPFDKTAIDFLEKLNVPFYKIASFENTDHELIANVAKTGKPVVMSTGMATIDELAKSVQVLRENGCNEFVLLKCTSTYPANPENTNILTIPHMKELFKCEVGLSDHTMGVGVSVASVALGASFIEKHFTLSRAEGGVDSAFSLEPQELKSLVLETERAWQSLGEVEYGVSSKQEEKSKQFRKSLFIVRDLKAGEIISPENTRAIRPGFGLPVENYQLVMGRKIKKDVSIGTPLTWDLI